MRYSKSAAASRCIPRPATNPMGLKSNFALYIVVVRSHAPPLRVQALARLTKISSARRKEGEREAILWDGGTRVGMWGTALS